MAVNPAEMSQYFGYALAMGLFPLAWVRLTLITQTVNLQISERLQGIRKNKTATPKLKQTHTVDNFQQENIGLIKPREEEPFAILDVEDRKRTVLPNGKEMHPRDAVIKHNGEELAYFVEKGNTTITVDGIKILVEYSP